MIGGVCGGIARTLGVDPVVVRVVTAVLGLLGGTGFAAYILAWILIPSDDGSNALQDAKIDRSRLKQIFLIAVVVIAGISLVDSLPGRWDGAGFLVFLVILAIAWQAFGSDWFNGTSFTHSAVGDAQNVRIQQGPDGQTVTVESPVGTTVIRRQRKSVLGRLVWNGIVLVVGVLLLLNVTDVTDISGRAIIAIALGLTGLGLVVSAVIGRARGLIALGLLLGVLTIPGSMHFDSNDTGDRLWQPISASAAAVTNYNLGAGNATLDLTDVVAAMKTGESVDLSARVGVGQLTVLLPLDTDANYRVTSRTTIGEIHFLNSPIEQGLDQSSVHTLTGSADAPTINLDLSTEVGQIEVRYA